MLRIKLVKSVIGHTPRNRATVAALGLRKTHSVVEHDDTPTIRGMIHHVKHLLEVTEHEGEAKKKQSPFQRPMKRDANYVKPVKKKAEAKPRAALVAATPKPKAAKAAPVAKAEAKVVAKAEPKVEAKAAAKPAAKAAPKAEAKPKAAKAAAKKDK